MAARFSWMRDVQQALRRVRRTLKKGLRFDSEKLLAAIRVYVRAHEKAGKMGDLFRAHADEHGGAESDLRDMLQESAALQRKQDYMVSAWLEELATVVERLAADDRDVLEDFAALWKWMQSAASQGRIHPRPALAKALREATPNEVREFEGWMREDLAAADELVRELRSAAQRLTDAAVERAAEKKRR